jgi:hypothetical protein
MYRQLRHLIPPLLTIIMVVSALQAIPSSAVAAQDTGTIRVLFRGCPDGPINPYTNSLDTCTTPLDAPDEAKAFWNLDGTGNHIMLATDVEREFNGAYLVENVPVGAEVSLLGFHPVAHNNFEIIGGDDTIPPDPWTAKVTVGAGDTRDIIAFYWNGEGGNSEEPSSTLELTLRGCPDGVDPTTLSDPTTECTIPLDAPDDARLIWDMEGGASVPTAPRQNDGTYVLDGIPAFQHVGLAGFEPTVRDAFHMTGTDYMSQSDYPVVRLAHGDERHVWVFYYNETGGGDSSPVSYGTINVTLRGCPDGVNPTTSADPYAECTIPLDAPEFAGVQWEGEGQGGIPLSDVSRLYDGTYHVEFVATNVPLTLGGFEPTVRDSYVMFGIDGVDGNGIPFLNSVAPGETVQIHVFYYDAG